MRLEFQLRDGSSGHYAFRVGARPQGGYEVQNEECLVERAEAAPLRAWFRVRQGRVSASREIAPPASIDRLCLVNAAGLGEFKPVYDALSRMGFYSLNPDRIRDLQSPEAGEILARDGRNIASVLAQLARQNPSGKKRIEEYLGKVVAGVQGVDTRELGPKETLEFRQRIVGSKDPWRFFASSMLDGTLRALGILVSLFQSLDGGEATVPLVGIEEPELVLHPAAAGVLLDGLRDASEWRQVVVTSHSPDPLDDPGIPASSLLAVYAEQGSTQIAEVDEAGRNGLHDHLYTAGELLRLNQLQPDRAAIERLASRQFRLFDETEPE